MVTKAKATPDTQEGFEEVLNDHVRVADLQAKGEFPGFIREYARRFALRDPEIQQQVEEQQEKVLTKFFEKNGVDLKKPAGRRLPMGEDLDGEDAPGALSLYKGLGLTPQQRRQIAANGRGAGVQVSGKFNGLADLALAATVRSTSSWNGVSSRDSSWPWFK